MSQNLEASFDEPSHSLLEEAVSPRPSRAQLAQDFEALIEREGAALARVAAAYEADPGRREDLFQEICLAIWRALPSFRGEASARTYVFRIAHNRGLSAAARRRALAVDLDQAPEPADLRPGPEERLSDRERQERLLAAVRRLPLALRQPLVLTLEGLAQREVSEIIGITETNVAVRLFQARKVLRRSLGVTEEA